MAASELNTQMLSTQADNAPDPALPKDLCLYELDASCLSDAARKLMEQWSGILQEQVNDHVNAIV
jgi:hypothetical protein